MGSPVDSEYLKADEAPQIEISVAPMWVGKFEITWAEYKEFMALYKVFKKLNAAKLREVTPENLVDAVTAPTPLFEPSFTFEYGEDPQQPAVTITQYSAKQYTKWLSKLTGNQYRLPTEAEWEYACRAGTTTPWSWGENSDEIDEYACFFDNSSEGPAKVGQRKPNAFGLYDMHGNAAEWTIDYYSKDGYVAYGDQKLDAIAAGKFGGAPYPRVIRGGSWEMEPADLRSASRLASDDEEWKSEDPNLPLSPWWYTSDPARGVGFRIVRSYQPLDQEIISKFWEIDAEDIQLDVQSRIDEGRGANGIVDPSLPKIFKELK